MKNIKYLVILYAFLLVGCADNIGLVGQPEIQKPSNLSMPQPDTTYSDSVSYAESTIYLSVYFAKNKYNLDSGYNHLLNKISDYLKKNPNATVQLQGNASDSGGKKYNYSLSMNRAKAVEQYLLNNGVGGNQISTVAFGYEKPFYSGYDKNRRVDIVFTTDGQAPDGYGMYQARIPYINVLNKSISAK